MNDIVANRMDGWAAIAGFLIACAVVAAGMLIAARLLRVRATTVGAGGVDLKTRAYECGEEPASVAWVRFHPRYLIVALFFVLFDVETAFLLPWAVGAGELGARATIAVFVFLGILMLGWAYAVRKGVLRWQ